MTNTDPAEVERVQNFVQQTVWPRWQIYEKAATRGDLPADARKDR